MVTYRNTRTGRVVELDEPNGPMDRSTRWQRVEEPEDITPIEPSGPETAPAEPKPAEVRAWAREHGIEVNARGALPAELVERYKAAHEE